MTDLGGKRPLGLWTRQDAGTRIETVSTLAKAQTMRRWQNVGTRLTIAFAMSAAITVWPVLAVSQVSHATPPAPLAERTAKARPGAQLHDRLFVALKAARSEADGRAIENEIWRFWLAEAPDSETRALIDEAMKKRGVYDTEGAEALLDDAISKSPNYAEAYNQRAFVRFLRDDIDGALEDADRALAREPKHFGAMAGRAMILMRQGRFRLAQDQLRQAVEIHPFLKERSMIVPTEPGRAPETVPSQPKGIEL